MRLNGQGVGEDDGIATEGALRTERGAVLHHTRFVSRVEAEIVHVERSDGQRKKKEMRQKKPARASFRLTSADSLHHKHSITGLKGRAHTAYSLEGPTLRERSLLRRAQYDSEV